MTYELSFVTNKRKSNSRAFACEILLCQIVHMTHCVAQKSRIGCGRSGERSDLPSLYELGGATIFDVEQDGKAANVPSDDSIDSALFKQRFASVRVRNLCKKHPSVSSLVNSVHNRSRNLNGNWNIGPPSPLKGSLGYSTLF